MAAVIRRGFESLSLTARQLSTVFERTEAGRTETEQTMGPYLSGMKPRPVHAAGNTETPTTLANSNIGLYWFRDHIVCGLEL
jgi:hypothetical protein